MTDPYIQKLAKLAVILTICGYVPMVLSLKILRHGGAFELLGSFFQ